MSASASLQALDLTFRSESDFSDHWKAVAGKPSVQFANDEGGLVRFSSADKLTFARLSLVNRQERFLGLEEGTVEITFRFKDLMESFGVLMRVTGDDANAYLVLVNLSENQATALRIFKVSPVATPDKENMLIFTSTKLVVPNEWYRLRMKVKNIGKSAVALEGELSPESGGAPILSAETKDESDPVLGPGQINLRFYATNVPSEIEVKKVSISPDPSVLR